MVLYGLSPQKPVTLVSSTGKHQTHLNREDVTKYLRVLLKTFKVIKQGE